MFKLKNLKNISEDVVYTVDSLDILNQFKRIDSPKCPNRAVDENHVRKIKKALENGERLPSVSVELHSLTEIDGQHRIEAARRSLAEGKKVSLRVVFEDFKGDVDAAMRYAVGVNANPKKWNDKDYLAYYKFSKPSYSKLEDFALNNSLCYSISSSGKKNIKLTTATRLVMGPNFKRTAIREGSFYATDKDFQNAVEFHNELKRILEIKGYVNSDKTGPNMGNSFENMIVGWINFRNGSYREMEKIGGFNAYCQLAVDKLDMSVCTKTKDWEERFYSILNGNTKPLEK